MRRDVRSLTALIVHDARITLLSPFFLLPPCAAKATQTSLTNTFKFTVHYLPTTSCYILIHIRNYSRTGKLNINANHVIIRLSDRRAFRSPTLNVTAQRITLSTERAIELPPRVLGEVIELASISDN